MPARSDRFAQWTRDAVEKCADSFVSVRRCELGGTRTLAVPLGGFNSFGKAIGRCAVMLTAPSEREEADFGPELATEVSFEVEEDDETFPGGETAGGSTRNDTIDGRYSPYAATSGSSASGASTDAVVDARPGSPTARLALALGVSADDDDAPVTSHRTGVFSNASEAYRSLKRALAKPGVDERDVRAALRGNASWAPAAARGTAATEAKNAPGRGRKPYWNS